MRPALVIALLVASGCAAEETPPPIGGGGGGTGGGGGGEEDAGPGADGGDRLAGKLCSAVDLRVPLACPAADLGGIDVSSGDASATTGAAGDFSLDLAPDADVLVSIGGGDQPVREALFASAMWRAEGRLRAPAVDQEQWNQLVAGLSGLEPDGTASIALYIEDESGPIAGAEILAPEGSQAPFYDSGAAEEWIQGGQTSGFGAVLIFAVPVFDPAAQIVIAVDTATYTVTVPIADDRLTFARVLLDRSGA